VSDEASDLVSAALFASMIKSRRWEDRHGAIAGTIQLLASLETVHHVKKFAKSLIEGEDLEVLLVDEEFRVRDLVSSLLFTVFAKGYCSDLFIRVRNLLINLITRQLE